MIVRMNDDTKTFPQHACQFCGCDRKLVETIIDDEFYWDETTKTYQPNGFTPNYETPHHPYIPPTTKSPHSGEFFI
jgi:hypothetical protein